MKEQKNSPEEELNEMEASNLIDIDFKVMIIRILNSMDKDKKRKKHKKDQSEIKNAII